MRFQDALENARLVIVALIFCCLLLIASNVALVWGLASTQSKMTVYVPPTIPTSGLNVTAGQVPNSTAFAFAFYVWQSINHWPKNGARNYLANIKHFSPYLTPRFKNYLLIDFHNRFEADEVQDRIRTMQGMNGSIYNPKQVKYIGHGTWLVHLDMRLTGRINTDDSIVKDAEISYVLRVVKYNVSATKNKYGLALDGFAIAPKRLKTFV